MFAFLITTIAVLLLIALAFILSLYIDQKDSMAAARRAESRALEEASEADLRSQETKRINERLLPYSIIADVDDAAKRLTASAKSVQQKALAEANYYQRIAHAMRSRIEGYGDQYLMPAGRLLDGLAEEFDHKAAGQKLAAARATSRQMVKMQEAAQSEYVDMAQRAQATAFVLDAFNGRVDSILADVRHDNVGKLRQRIRDVFTLVNVNGRAFGNTEVARNYLNARLAELRWAATVQELKAKEREEQRSIREQMREEEKVRRETERAIKEAEKEEKLIREALAIAQARADRATDAQRADFEKQLTELNGKLQDAEDRNRRALSMAQQTRRGHVYIISNVGSFGNGIYKIGLTRRLEPLDRIKELGDASVPFPFDIHAILFSDDSPALEASLHKAFARWRVNKVNHRKEFFRLDIASVKRKVELLGVNAHWTMASEAAEHRESLVIDRLIGSDPSAFEAWQNHQLVLDDGEEVLAGVGVDEDQL